MANLGHGWITDYMSKAFAHLEPHVAGPIDAGTVQAALDNYHDEFAKNWLGTEADLGPLVKLIQAGMAAGQQAIVHGSAANPTRPMLGKAVEVDWSLLAREARDFAQQYLYNLIRNLDDTTRASVQDAVAKWIESGEGLDKLKDSLQTIFNDEARAQLIAQTESTRAYAEGSQERYRRADVKYVKWNTVRSGTVCPTCEALGKEAPAPIEQGFKAASGNAFPPNHPGCRCWLRPVVEDE
jgi:SPP1 gp7 family putative phage head morphogenesis protein